MLKDTILTGIGFLALIALFCVFVGFPMMLLVNYLFSAEFLTFIFGAPAIGFWKAFWLVFFGAIMFRGSSGMRSDRSG
jgi:hypothetical protein